MTLNSALVSQINSAIKNVFGIKSDISDVNIQKLAEELWYFSKPYEFEDEANFAMRMTTDLDYAGLSAYFVEIDGKFEAESKIIWEKFFEIGRKFGILDATLERMYPGEQTKFDAGYENAKEISYTNIQTPTSTPEGQMEAVKPTSMELQNTNVGNSETANNTASAEDTDPNIEANNYSTIPKGGNTMSTQEELRKEMDDLMNEAGGRAGAPTKGDMPQQVTKSERIAAKNTVAKNKQKAMEYSQNVKVGEVYVTTIKKADRIKGYDGSGKFVAPIKDPKKALKKFHDITGWDASTGEYKHRPAAFPLEKYEEMRRMLEDAVNGNNPAIAVQIPEKFTPAIRGVRLTDDMKTLLKNSELSKHILQNCYGVLDVVGESNAQFQLTLTKKQNKRNVTWRTQVANKQAMLESSVCKPFKALDKGKDAERPVNFRSEAYIEYEATMTQDGVEKTVVRKWGPTLDVPQYAEIGLEGLEKLTERVGVTITRKDITDQKEATSIMEIIESIVLEEHGKKDSMLSTGFRAEFDEQQQKAVTEAQEVATASAGAPTNMGDL